MNEFETLRQMRPGHDVFERIRASSLTGLPLQKILRSEFAAEIVRAALTLLEVRTKARAKFSRAGQMWLDRTGFEQSTAETVAQHKAVRFQGSVWDLCCGIGGDSIAMAQHAEVIAVDRNPSACLRTQRNADVYGVGDNVATICADANSLQLSGQFVHVDPDRRTSGVGRTLRIEQCEPGLEFLLSLLRQAAGGAIKLSPASNFADRFPGAEYELISLDGECKEATVWFGELAQPGIWRATVLPSGDTLAGHPLDAYAPTKPLGRFLYDPDPAIVRSGLLNLLCEQFGLARIDSDEEYLTSDAPIDTPFARRFEVIAELANNDREIRRFFRDGDYGTVEIKCRHLRIDADAIRRRLSLAGTEPIVLIYARIAGKARSVVCRRDDKKKPQARMPTGE